MKVYTQVSIRPHNAGFGQYEAPFAEVSTQCSYAEKDELLGEIYRESESLPIEDALKNEDFQEAGVEDIRGRIRNQPDEVFATVFDGAVHYFGISASEVPDDFYGEQ